MTPQQALFQAQQQLDNVYYLLAGTVTGSTTYAVLIRERDRLVALIEDLEKLIASSGEVPPGYQPPPSGGGKPDPFYTSGNDSTAKLIMWGSAALVLIAIFGSTRKSR